MSMIGTQIMIYFMTELFSNIHSKIKIDAYYHVISRYYDWIIFIDIGQKLQSSKKENIDEKFFFKNLQKYSFSC